VKNADGTDGDILTISGGVIRKQIETEGEGHDQNVKSMLCAALQHTETTKKRYYYVDSAETARQQHRMVSVVEQSGLAREHILEQ